MIFQPHKSRVYKCTSCQEKGILSVREARGVKGQQEELVVFLFSNTCQHHLHYYISCCINLFAAFSVSVFFSLLNLTSVPEAGYLCLNTFSSWLLTSLISLSNSVATPTPRCCPLSPLRLAHTKTDVTTPPIYSPEPTLLCTKWSDKSLRLVI